MVDEAGHATLPGYLDLRFPAPPAGRPYVIVNMVMSADGKIVIEDTERGLGSRADQRLMGSLRSHVDAVLNGAETLRTSGSTPDTGNEEFRALRVARGLSPAPLGVVLSRSGNVPLESPFFTSRDFEAAMVLLDSTPVGRRRAIEATGRRVVVVPAADPVPPMLHSLRHEFGVGLLLCEGGATLNGSLFDAGMVDEYFVTIGPRIVGGNGALTPVRGDREPSFEAVTQMRLRSAVPNDETGELYLRYQVGTSRP